MKTAIGSVTHEPAGIEGTIYARSDGFYVPQRNRMVKFPRTISSTCPAAERPSPSQKGTNRRLGIAVKRRGFVRKNRLHHRRRTGAGPRRWPGRGRISSSRGGIADQEQSEKFLRMVPQKRYGAPEEIKGLALYLTASHTPPSMLIDSPVTHSDRSDTR